MAFSRTRLEREKAEIKNAERILNLKIVKPGDAVNFPMIGDSCAVHYVGYLEDGTCFDNSYNRGQPVHFILGAGQVLKGFEEILPILSRGEKARITVPPEFGYGDKGYPPIIAPKSTLMFEIELISFSSVGNAERLHRAHKAEQAAAQAAVQALSPTKSPHKKK